MAERLLEAAKLRRAQMGAEQMGAEDFAVFGQNTGLPNQTKLYQNKKFFVYK